jgi:hypothetical protein
MVFFDRARYPRDKENSLKLLRIEMENYSYHHDNGNILN